MVDDLLERFSKGGYGISDILQFSEIWGGPGTNFLILELLQNSTVINDA